MVVTGSQANTPPSASPQDAPRRRAPQNRMIRRARILAWALTAALAALIAVFVVQLGMFEGVAPPPPTPGAVAPDKVTKVQDPHFTGFDRERQPYSVSAASARQSETEPSRVFLETVRGELKLRESGDILLVVADEGLYDSKSDTLDLSGNVRLTSTGQYTARLETARVFLESWRVRSEDPVEVTFTDGTVHANGMEIKDDGGQILFFNKVRGTVSGDRGKQDQR